MQCCGPYDAAISALYVRIANECTAYLVPGIADRTVALNAVISGSTQTNVVVGSRYSRAVRSSPVVGVLAELPTARLTEMPQFEAISAAIQRTASQFHRRQPTIHQGNGANEPRT